ncbi:endolytic transglycosylase MltG [Polynucleobacter paneuropaeus]|uniref:Endolytic murein transglycosylase n=1 Tax=Polynucleobacter paneuropaeus TaxID=2527775 RepID=A0A2Z4JV90_9BURK|nr:endolytic transglycosylase MltG [Polynucleobacter paneuropaeus]AWW50670.1 endolytic transglycosylase MltG [Polynucleobacter paneuropaeus]
MSQKFQKMNLLNLKKQPSWVLWLLGACAALLMIFYAAIFLVTVVPANSNFAATSGYKVKIQPKSGLSNIARQMQEQGLSVNPLVLQISARALFVGSRLKPGTYLFPLDAGLGRILLQMARGDRVKESVAIIPGMTIWQVRALIDAHPALIHQTRSMSSKVLLAQLHLAYPSLEGAFFPDTYVFDPEELDIVIYQRAAQAMQKQLLSAWSEKTINSPLKTPYELLILASIIEKETGRPSDRNLIAAVFLNRLKQGMKLQTDPTVIYGIGPKFDGNLRKADLSRSSPYNTYMHIGLPPTPISMPSKESLLAAVAPADSKALFFVARGDGTSHFSTTLSEHESAVDQYQRKKTSPIQQH